MKKLVKRIMFLSFTLLLFINLSGCAKVYKDMKTMEIYPINYDFFWDKWFIRPIAETMYYITDHAAGSFALGIIITTIIIRTILFPIYTKSNNTSTKMQEIQPEMKKIQAKYAGKTDPDSKNKMQFEIMKLYKDNNVNMLAGCLMPFLQMPIFLAMYNTVVKLPASFPNRFTNLHTEFLWLDLSQTDSYYILPILVGVTSYLMQYITMYGLSEDAKKNPTMKMMTWLMPAMMLIFSFSQASALSLYWIIGNIFSTLQIIFVKRPFRKEAK